MEPLGLYLIKSAIVLAIFFSIYYVLLRNETFFRFNRFFLLAGVLAAVVFPFITLQYTEYISPVIPEELTLQAATMPLETGTHEALTNNDASRSISPRNMLLTGLFIAYITGIFGLLLYRLYGIVRLIKVVRRNGYSRHDSYLLVETPLAISPFSFFRFIFLSTGQTETEEKERVIKHEQAHIEQRHWIDLLLMEAVCLLQWFNPLAWIYDRALRENHEYLADRAVLQMYSRASYQQTLLSHWLRCPVYPVINSFYYSSPLKRFRMMKKHTSHPRKQALALLVVPALVTFLWSFAQPQYIMTPYTDTPATLSEKSQKVSPESQKVLEKSEKVLPAKEKVAEKDKPKADNNSTQESRVIPEVPAPSKEKPATDTVRRLSHPAVKLHVPPGFLPQPLVIVDGEATDETMDTLNELDIYSMTSLRDSSLIEKYGERAAGGVIIITTKKNKDKAPEVIKKIDITGTITNEVGDPLPEISVVSFRGDILMTTDEKGSFKMHIHPYEALCISGKGYVPIFQGIPSNTSHLSIKLKKLVPGVEVEQHILERVYPRENLEKINTFLSVTMSERIKKKGELLLHYLIDENGKFRVTDLQLVKGSPELKQEVEEVLKDVPQVAPPTIQGVPVKMIIKHTVIRLPWTDSPFLSSPPVPRSIS